MKWGDTTEYDYFDLDKSGWAPFKGFQSYYWPELNGDRIGNSSLVEGLSSAVSIMRQQLPHQLFNIQKHFTPNYSEERL